MNCTFILLKREKPQIRKVGHDFVTSTKAQILLGLELLHLKRLPPKFHQNAKEDEI